MLDALYADVAPFATAEDLADYPGGAALVDFDVTLACAIVRGLVGWHISPAVTLTFELNSDGSDVIELPTYHVGSVTSVKDGRGVDAVELEGWTWSHNGLLRIPCGRPRGLGNIVVTAVSGLAEPPMDLLAVVADIARQRYEAGRRPIGVKQKTVGGVSYTYVDDSELVKTGGTYARYAPILDRFVL